MKPFLAYIGSKQKFMNKLEPLFPETINNYYEPFVGGGSVLFYLNENYDIKKNYINDLDSDLINVYNVIKNNTNELLNYLEELNNSHSKKDFNLLVDAYNTKKQDKILLAAIYIYINKRAFNGKLNYIDDNIKPYYSLDKKNTHIYDNDNVLEINNLLKSTSIYNTDFIKFINKIKPKKGDFVFFDPPYLVKNVGQYYKDIFDINNFIELKKVCDKLNSQNINFMITLNKHSKLKEIFKKYNIKTFKKYSTLSSGKYNEYEMIIRNY